MADGAGDTACPFETSQDGNIPPFAFELTAGGACIRLQFPLESEFTITELNVHGWVLDHVNCDTSGVSRTEFRNGVILTCHTNGGGGECDFVNVPAPIRSAIPTLSEWGMFAAATGLGLIGLFFAVRRRKAVA